MSGPLCQKLGCRPVAMIGGIFGGTGLVLGATVANMRQLSWCLVIAGKMVIGILRLTLRKLSKRIYDRLTSYGYGEFVIVIPWTMTASG